MENNYDQARKMYLAPSHYFLAYEGITWKEPALYFPEIEAPNPGRFDWRYEFAGRAMQAFIGSEIHKTAMNDDKNDDKKPSEVCAKLAVKYADALIEELERE